MHPALPQSLTPEALADWIVQQAAESNPNTGTKILSDEDRAELEHTSSSCSQELDMLKEIVDRFNAYIKDGTYNDDTDQIGATVTIPATIGTKQLKAERENADKICRDGHRKENIVLYSIPWPEEKKMVVVDIEGQEWEDRTRDMRVDEINKYGGLFASDNVADGPSEDDSREILEEEIAESEDDVQEETPVIEEKPKKGGRKPFI